MIMPQLDPSAIQFLFWGATFVGSKILDKVLGDYNAKKNVKWNPPLDTLKKCKEEIVERSEKKEGLTYTKTWMAHRWNGVEDITLRPVCT